MSKLRVAILISGRGSNMMALVEAASLATYPAEIVGVISNRADAKGLDFARSQCLAAIVIDHRAFPAREDFEAALDARLRGMNADIVACAGFMRVLSAGFVAGWEGRLINIHPSLLPAYKGLHTHERALADGAKVHGCTVHHVTAELDAGPVILQAEVPVLPGDTPDTLAARVLIQEHRIYPQALAMLAGSMTSARTMPRVSATEIQTDVSPRAVVNRQLAVYNAHDIDGYCALFADDATISDQVTGQAICTGIGEIRAVYTKRFADHPKLRAVVHQRMEGPTHAIDKETVYGLPSGDLHIMAIYEVRGGLIRSLKFIRWTD